MSRPKTKSRRKQLKKSKGHILVDEIMGEFISPLHFFLYFL